MANVETMPPISDTEMSARQKGAETNAGGFSVSSREKSLRGRDEFYKETYRFFDALGRHRTAVVVGAAVLVIGGVAGGIIANHREERAEAGRSALYLAQKSFETTLKDMAGYKAPPPEADGAKDKDADAAAKPEAEDPKAKAAKEAAAKARQAEEQAVEKKAEELTFSKMDVDAKFGDAIKKFQDVIAKFDGTRAAHEARMTLGTLYFNHGEPAKAAPLFEAAAKSAPNAFDKSMAYQSWGYALENDGKPADALSAYEKALNYSEGSIKGDCWLGIARCQVAMHDAAKARSTYDQIITQLPSTEASKTAEALKAKL